MPRWTLDDVDFYQQCLPEGWQVELSADMRTLYATSPTGPTRGISAAVKRSIEHMGIEDFRITQISPNNYIVEDTDGQAEEYL